MRGVIIDIEGLDGSGKETQSRLLCENIKKVYLDKINYISFPDYDSKSSTFVKMYLDGDFGDDPEDVNAYAASSFFAVDRFASYKKFWENDYKKGYFIIANRYVCSNLIYQMAKLEKLNWADYLTWVYDFEYNKLGLPMPDVTIYLKVPVDISQKLIEKRYSGDLSRKDLHESNVKFLNSCRTAAEYAANRCGWKVIDCVDENGLKSINKIQEEILSIVENIVSKFL